MRLLEIYAEEFGLLTDRRFAFGAGLNLIEGANESGKSTLVALLRFLFYGFPRRGGEESEERVRRLSRKGRRAAGSVTFLWQEKEVVLRREYVLHTMGGKESATECVQAFDRETGAIFELGAKSAGEYFLSLPQALYHSSACVRQSELEGIANGQTSDAVFEFLFGGQGGTRFERAVRLLDEARRELQHQRGTGGRIAQLSAEQEELQAALAQANDAAERLHVLGDEKRELAARVVRAQQLQTHLDGMLEAQRLDGELARYDEWHAAYLQEQEAARACNDARKARDGLPSAADVEAALAVARAYGAAIEKQTLYAEKWQEAQREAARHSPNAADRRVDDLGGAAAVEARVAALGRSVRTRGRLGAVWLLFSLLLAMGAVFAAPIRLLLACACGVSGIAALVSWCLCARARQKHRALLADFGLESPYMLRSFLTGYTQRAQARAAALQVLADARSVYDAAGAVCRTGEEALAHSLAALALTVKERESPEAALSALALQVQQISREVVQREQALVSAASVRQALEKGLDLGGEAALRAARAALPDPTLAREDLRREGEALREKLQSVQTALRTAEQEQKTLCDRMKSCTCLREQLQKNEAELAAARRRLAALKLAHEALGAADADLRDSVMPRLAREASEILATLTDGAYVRLHVPRGFEASIETGEGLFPLSHFSAGARDVTYFALRIALIGLLTSEPLPLLLDEVCARLDDVRAANLLRFLQAYCAKGAQCLLFTCHTREASMLDGAAYRRIVL